MMRQGMTVAVVIAAGTWAGAAAAQTQCGPFPVGEATLACACPAGFASGSVWGSGPYTADSDVCTAALHAGVIGPEGGKVMALAAEGLETYTGSDANGVSSRDWGSYPNSFTFEAAGLEVEVTEGGACGAYPQESESYTCSCDAETVAAGGIVWGSSPYTADSDICAAAVHAGVIADTGGMVTALRTAGLESYRGTAFNGVETFDWGAYGASFVFDYNQ